MQKEFYFDDKSQIELWDAMWTARILERELEACDLETPARDLFSAYIPKDGRVIDGGCGFGKWVVYLNRLGYDIVGIDNNELAITKLKEYDSSLQVKLGDILNIHYPDNSFAAYISMGVVEHFEEGPTQALKEAHRVLKANGLIFVSVPTVNVVRKLIRPKLRKAINVLPTSFAILRSGWGKSKRSAILDSVQSIGSVLPDRMKSFLARKTRRYYHFVEYRYSRNELENFLKQSGFEIVKTVAHDFYGTGGYSAGLVMDFPFLATRNGANFRLNLVGRLISRTLNKISPSIACSSILCVGRALKE